MSLAATIVHQTQPTPVCCTTTCIAMAMGIPVTDLGVPLDKAYGFEAFGVWLAERGVWMRQAIRIDNKGESFQQGGVYLITVRSRNKAETDHAVLLDARGAKADSRSDWKFFDPNQGREGKEIYEWVDENLALDFCELRDRAHPWARIAGSPPAHPDAGAAGEES